MARRQIGKLLLLLHGHQTAVPQEEARPEHHVQQPLREIPQEQEHLGHADLRRLERIQVCVPQPLFPRQLPLRQTERRGETHCQVDPQRRHEQRRTGRWRRKHRRRSGRRRDVIPRRRSCPIRRAPASRASSRESSRKSFQESSRHLRGIYAAVFPLLQGATHTASGRGIHIDEKGLQNKQPETEITPCRSLFRRG